MSQYSIQYSPEAFDHLSVFSTADQSLVLNEVEIHLSQQPAEPTRKRKLLRPNPIAPWALRLGDIRVFYEVEGAQSDMPARVTIKAIGKKVHNQLWIGAEKVEL
jgi:mRNA-degrading endonuclease RelE of RelBE toxin-antitoxin system